MNFSVVAIHYVAKGEELLLGDSCDVGIQWHVECVP